MLLEPLLHRFRSHLKRNNIIRLEGLFYPGILNNVITSIGALHCTVMLPNRYLTATIRAKFSQIAHIHMSLFLTPLAFTVRAKHHFLFRAVDHIAFTICTGKNHAFSPSPF